MQLLGILLILINVGAIVGPIAGVVIVYNGNMQEMIIPPEVQNTVENTLNVITSSSSEPFNPENPSGGGSSGATFVLPQYVSSTYNLAARTVTVVFNFTNPLNVTLTVNQVSADVRCHAHGFMLGHAAIPNAVEIPPAETVDLTVIFAWTEAAQNHILSDHAGESTVNVDLVNITVSVSGITFETPSTYNVDIPLC
jgi:hypothetical protein